MDDQQGRQTVLLEALVALAVAEREERLGGSVPARSEVILAGAGISLAETARLTGKNYEAVKKTIQRAKVKTARRDAGAGTD